MRRGGSQCERVRLDNGMKVPYGVHTFYLSIATCESVGSSIL